MKKYNLPFRSPISKPFYTDDYGVVHPLKKWRWGRVITLFIILISIIVLLSSCGKGGYWVARNGVKDTIYANLYIDNTNSYDKGDKVTIMTSTLGLYSSYNIIDYYQPDTIIHVRTYSHYYKDTIDFDMIYENAVIVK